MSRISYHFISNKNVSFKRSFIQDKIMRIRYGALMACLTASHVEAVELDISGNIGVESRLFFEENQFSDQLEKFQNSFYIDSELYMSWNEGNDSITVNPFYRVDQKDQQRTHFEIRELSYIHASDDWELRAGIRKEYWGVTEFQHLVDVINQTDSVEDIDGEDKLGQLMLNLSLIKDWGILDIYLMPGFQERTFVGAEGRFRGPLAIDSKNITYESTAKNNHLDLALRWTHTLGAFDIGGYWFKGTNREPVLNEKNNVLRQYYRQMEQLGLDIQATVDSYLWKLEVIHRDSSPDNFLAYQAGFEYLSVGFFGDVADLSFLMEYGWDSRGNAVKGSEGATYQNDLFFGNRISFNDIGSSEILFAIGRDLDHNTNTVFFEASSRIADNFRINLDLRIIDTDVTYDPFYYLSNDDHLQFSIDWYF